MLTLNSSAVSEKSNFIDAVCQAQEWGECMMSEAMIFDCGIFHYRSF